MTWLVCRRENIKQHDHRHLFSVTRYDIRARWGKRHVLFFTVQKVSKKLIRSGLLVCFWTVLTVKFTDSVSTPLLWYHLCSALFCVSILSLHESRNIVALPGSQPLRAHVPTMHSSIQFSMVLQDYIALCLKQTHWNSLNLPFVVA